MRLGRGCDRGTVDQSEGEQGAQGEVGVADSSAENAEHAGTLATAQRLQPARRRHLRSTVYQRSQTPETSVVVTSDMVAYSWGIELVDNQIDTHVRRLLNYLVHNFRLYLNEDTRQRNAG